MPLLYRSEYIKTELAPRPIHLTGATVAELGQSFDATISVLYENIRTQFATRSASVHYDPARQQIELLYRVDDTTPGTYFQYNATVAALINVEDLTQMQSQQSNPAPAQSTQSVEMYTVITASIKRIQHGYWTVFDNVDQSHEKLAGEIRALLTAPIDQNMTPGSST